MLLLGAGHGVVRSCVSNPYYLFFYAIPHFARLSPRSGSVLSGNQSYVASMLSVVESVPLKFRSEAGSGSPTRMGIGTIQIHSERHRTPEDHFMLWPCILAWARAELSGRPKTEADGESRGAEALPRSALLDN